MPLRADYMSALRLELTKEKKMKSNRKLIYITREQYLFLDNNGIPFLRKEDSEINYGNGGYGLNTMNECYTASFLYKKHSKESIKKCLNEIIYWHGVL